MTIAEAVRSRPFLAVLVFVLTLILYLATMPVSITLEDAGLFQMVCQKGGIGHPPGYPLFVLGCQGFTSLPWFGASVFAANCLSAICASAACAVLFLVCSEWLGRLDMALVAALMFGASATFWSQAVIVEVYSLSVLLFVLCLWLTLGYVRQTRPVWLVGLAFAYGLGLANHWPQLGLATPALLVLLWPVRLKLIAHIFSRWFFLLLAALLAGLAPYLSLFQAEPAFAIYGPVETWQEFIRYVSRAAYNDQYLQADWTDKARFQGWVALQTLQEFTLVLAPLMLVGLYRSLRVMRFTDALALVVLYLGGTSLLISMLGFEFSAIRIAIFEPYPVVAYIAPLVWTAFGCTWLVDSMRRVSDVNARLLPPVFVLVVVLGNFADNNRRLNQFAEVYGLQVLSMIPDDAILFVEGDNGVGLIGYLHYVAGERPDIELRSWNNLVFENRLDSPFLPAHRQEAARDAFIADATRPVFSTTSATRKGVRMGLVIRHNVKPAYYCPAGLHNFADYLLYLHESGSLSNGHERELLGSLLLDITQLHVVLVSGPKVQGAREHELLARLQQTFYGKIATVGILLQLPHDDYNKERLKAMIESAMSEMPRYPDRKLRAVMQEYLGRIALMAPADRELAIAHLENSVQIYPLADNASFCILHDAYVDAGRPDDAARIADQRGADLCP